MNETTGAELLQVLGAIVADSLAMNEANGDTVVQGAGFRQFRFLDQSFQEERLASLHVHRKGS